MSVALTRRPGTDRPWVRSVFVIVSVFVLLALVGVMVVGSSATAADHVVTDGESIQDAVNASEPGDTIVVEAGTYEEEVIVDVENVSIVAEDGETPILNGDEEDLDTAFTIEGVEDVVLEGFEVLDYRGASAIVVDEAPNTTIRETNATHPGFGGNDGAGIDISNSPDVVIEDVLVEDHDDGILVVDSDDVKIENTTAAGNTGDHFVAGIQVEHSQDLTVEGSTLTENSDGIRLRQGAHGTVVENSTIVDNTDTGVNVHEANYLEVRNTTASDNGDEGIRISESIGTVLTENEIEYASREPGVIIESNSHGTIVTNNAITNNDDVGILVEESDDVTIATNAVEDNSQWVGDDAGIHLRGTENVSITDNEIHGNERHGIFIDGEIEHGDFGPNVDTLIENNSVSDHELDLDIVLSYDATVVENDFESGVVLDGNTLGHFEHEFDENTVNGEAVYYASGEDDPEVPTDAGQVIVVDSTNVEVADTAYSDVASGIQIAYSDGAVVADNSLTAMDGSDHLHYDRGAITIWGSAAAIVEENTVDGTDWAGISVQDTEDTTVASNDVTETELVGIFTDGATGTDISGNTVTDSVENRGIYLRDDSDDATVVDNVVTGNEWDGIQFHESAGATIANNTVADNDRGITVWHAGDVTIAENTITDNHWQGAGARHGEDENWNVTVEANEISGSQEGISTSHQETGAAVVDNLVEENDGPGIRAQGGLITDNTVTANADHGIWSSHDAVVENNSVTDNDEHGIQATDDEGEIRDNTVADNALDGIHLDEWEDGPVENNTVSGHAVDLRTVESTNATVVDNAFESGAFVDGKRTGNYQSGTEEYVEHEFENNTVGGDPLFYTLDGEDVTVPEDAGQAIVANSTDVTIGDLDSQDAATPVQITYSDGVTVSNSTFSGSTADGIHVGVSENVTIEASTITESADHGLSAEDVGGFGVTDSTVSENAEYGLTVELLDPANESVIANSTVAGNEVGIDLFAETNDINGSSVSGNTIYDNERGLVVTDNAEDLDVYDNSIQGNDEYGLVYDPQSFLASPDLDATENWWGNESGPSGDVIDACTDVIADGDGDAIDDDDDDSVCFDPWLEDDPGDGPTALFTYDPDEPEVGEEVTFDAGDSSAPGEIVEYRWDFTGDGAFDEETADPESTWTYDDADEYTVTLEVEDDEGDEAETTQLVTVDEVDDPEPNTSVVDAELSDDTIEVGESVTVDATVENDGNETGQHTAELLVDGEVENETTVEVPAGENETIDFVHTFEAEGEYEVSVDDVDAGTVTVEDGPSVVIFGGDVDRSELTVNETATIEGDLYNSGDEEQSVTVNLTIDGEAFDDDPIDDTTVTVEPGIDRDSVVFEWTPDEDDLPPGSDRENVTVMLDDFAVETLPLENQFSDLAVMTPSVSEAELVEDESFHAVGNLYQAGTIEGPEPIELTAIDQDTGEETVLASENMSLTPGHYHLGGANLTGAIDEPGTYDVELGGEHAGEVAVEEAVSDLQVISASTSDDELIEDESFYVVGSLYQAGTIAGPETIELTAIDQDTGEETVLASENTSLAPGHYHLGGANLTGSIDEPGAYDVELGGEHAGEVEVEEAVSDLQVISASASDDEIVENESFYAVGSLYQAGNVEGPEEIELTAIDQATGEETVLATTNESLTPGHYHLGGANLTGAIDEPGTYDVELGGEHAGEVEVEAAVSNLQVISASASDDELIEDESFYAVGSLYQAGNVEGPEEIELAAIDQNTGEETVLASENTSLAPGHYHLGGANLSGAIDEPGTYDVELGGEHAGEVEVEEAVSDLEVVSASVSDDELVENESFYAVGSLYQAGNVEGPEEIELTAIDQNTGEETVLATTNESVEPGYYHLGGANVTGSIDEPGTYDVELGGEHAGEVEVEEAFSDIVVVGTELSAVEVLQDESFYVVGSLYQAGNVEGPEEIELTATDKDTGEETVLATANESVEPGYYHLGAANVSAEIDEPGNYSLELGDRAVGTISVEEIVSDVRIVGSSIEDVELVENDTTQIVGSAYQNGSHTVTEEVELVATDQDGESEVVGSQEITLDPGEYKLGAINISYTPTEAGTYDLELGDHDAGEVEVEEAISDLQVVSASVSDDEIVENESFYAVGSLYQAGTIDEPEAIDLTAIDQETGEETVLATTNESVPPGQYHLGGANLTGSIDEAGTYDIELGGEHAGEVAVEEAVSDLQVISASASDDEIVENESFYAVGNLYQGGNIEGPEEVDLTAIDQETGEETVLATANESVEPGHYHLGGANLTGSIDEPGTYDVELGGQDAGEVEVQAAVSDLQVIAASVSADELVENESFHVVGNLYQGGNIEGPEEIELTAIDQDSGEETVLATANESLEPGHYHLGGANLTGSIDEPGTYDVELGGQDAGEVEVEKAVSDLQVISASVSDDELAQTESFHAVGSLYQAGTIAGPETIELTAIDQDTGEETVLATTNESVQPGYYHLGGANLTGSIDEPGTYDVELSGEHAGSVTVDEPHVAPSIVDVEGHSSGIDPETGSPIEYASESATVEMAIDADLDLAEVTVLVDSLETNYVVGTAASHESGDTWTAEVPLDDLPDDGQYALSVIAVDELEYAGSADAAETLEVDRAEPSMSVAVEDVTTSNATVVVESDRSLLEPPAVTAESSPTQTIEMASEGGDNTTFTGTIEFDESGNYSITAIGTDVAGNEGEDTASVVIDSGFTLGDGTIVIDESGSTIDFDVDEDAEESVLESELFVALSENAIDTNLDDGDLGAGFLHSDLDDFVDYNLETGTIESANLSVAIDEESLPDGADVSDTQLHHYNESEDDWSAVPSTVTTIDDDPFVQADVEQFSTYGAIVPDDEPPSIDAVSPEDGETLEYDTEEVTIHLEYDDALSGVDVSSVSLEVDGTDVTDDADTTITSAATEHVLAVEQDTTYEAVIVVADEAGNEATESIEFAVDSPPEDPPEDPPDPGNGGAPPPDPAPAFSLLDVNLDTTTIDVGQSMTISAILENAGDADGEETIELAIDGEVVDEQTLTVEAGETADVTFDRTFDEPGKYEVSLGDVEAGVVEVSPEPVADITVTDGQLSDSEVAVGESVTVTATVENVGDAAGEHTAALEVDGDVVDEASISLEAGETGDLSFTHTFDDAGEYEVDVDGTFAGTVSVPAIDDTGDDSDDIGDDADDDADDAIPGFGVIVVLVALSALSAVGYRLGRSGRYGERSTDRTMDGN